MADSADDRRRLAIARDYAAYRAVGAIDAAICYCRQGDAKMALAILTHAREDYERADVNLQNLNTQKGEISVCHSVQQPKKLAS